jgi:hypothetical protein
MFFFFKTKVGFKGSILDPSSLGDLFIHDTGSYENKVCMFGKIMALIAIVFWIVRLYLMNSPEYKSALFNITLGFDVLCILLAAIMNLNALVYILPIIPVELYFLNQLLAS